MNVLHVVANPKPEEDSVSRSLATTFFATLSEHKPEAEVTTVDLYEDPPPFLALGTYRNFWYPNAIEGYQPTDEDKEAASYAYQQCELLKHADVLVLTMPLWSCAAPAIMKAWLEHIFIPGETYEVAGNTVKPLHHLKKIILLVASGEVVTEEDPLDALTPQIRSSFGLIGMEDIAIAWADGQDPKNRRDFEVRKNLALEAAQELAEEVAEFED